MIGNKMLSSNIVIPTSPLILEKMWNKQKLFRIKNYIIQS